MRESNTIRLVKQFICLLVILMGIADVCLGWGAGHKKIAVAAFKELPDWQKAKWKDSEKGLTTRYCLYPDWGLGNSEAKPYLVVVRGRLFHYFPRDNRSDYLMFMSGARTYIEKITAAMRGGDYADAAKFAGAFTHTLEDLSQPECHSLEGINGFSWTILDEIFTPEDQSWNRGPQSIIGLDSRPAFKVDISGYAPKLLGEHPREVAFRLYQRVCMVRRAARKALPAIFAKTYAGDLDGAARAAVVPANIDAKIIADMYYTCFSLANDRVDAAEVKKLETFDLTSLVPHKVPALIPMPYRFSPLAYGVSVNRKRQPVPMTLFIEEGGQKKEVTFKKGIATSCCTFSYEIPANVFKEFRCWAGLHSQLSREGKPANLRLKIKLKGKTVFDSGKLTAGSTAKKVVIPMAGGGMLSFTSSGNPGLPNNYSNQTVWANPVFVRLPKSEVGKAAPVAETKGPPSAGAPAKISAVKGKNILTNSSFEEWPDDSTPASWSMYPKGGAVAKETKEIHSGKAAAKITVGDSGKAVFICTPYSNKPGKRYRLSFFWKSEIGVIQYAIKKGHKGWVGYTGAAWVRKNANLIATGGTEGWNRTVVEFDAFEEEMKINVEICRPAGKGVGYSFYVDDVTVEELPAGSGY